MNTNWESLRVFLALARHKTLTRAGESLQVSHATIYRKIKAFERELGVTLFENTPKGYSQTSAAEQLFEEMKVVENNIETSLRELRGLDQRIQGNIILATTDTFGCKLLPPILKKFQLTYPELSIELKISMETVSLSKREADIAVRTSAQPPPNLAGRKVGSIEFAVFAAQSYLKNCDPIQFPDDVDKHNFVVLDDSFGHLAIKQWMDRQISTVTTVTKVNGMLPLIELCEAGMGLAALPTFAVNSGCSDLIKVYPIPELLEHHLWVLTHRDLTRSTRVRITTEFLYRELKPFFSNFRETDRVGNASSENKPRSVPLII